ncbi:hypothetical protein [uncultured Winogradskyella sp.]|jgi:hypothetical protein
MSPLQYLRKRLLKENTNRWRKETSNLNLKSENYQVKKNKEEEDTFLFI